MVTPKMQVNWFSAFAIFILSISVNLTRGQDCSRFQILELKDTIIQNNPSISFLLTSDTLIPGSSSGYTSMFFVSSAGDTLNPITWSQHIPTLGADTVLQILSFVNGFTSFPPNFSGFLIMRAPDCVIPFELGSVGIDAYSDQNLNLYPNPTSGLVQINGLGANAGFHLYNSQGQLLDQGIQFANGNTYDLSDQPSGLLWMIIDQDGDYHVLKVLKE